MILVPISLYGFDTFKLNFAVSNILSNLSFVFLIVLFSYLTFAILNLL